MIKFTKLEVDFMKLRWVRHRCLVIYKKFPEIQGSDRIANLFRAVLQETIIVQLHNFNIIRKSLILDTKVKDIDQCLEPLWKPIDDYKEGIKLYRHNFIAHIQDRKNPFELMPEHIIDEYQMPTLFGEWLFRAGCVMFYCQQLEENFKKEWDSADRKYQAKVGVPLKYGLIRLGTYKKELTTRLAQSIQNLKDKKLQYLDSREKND